MKKLIYGIIVCLVLCSCGNLRPNGDPKIYGDCVEQKSPAWIVSEVGIMGEHKESLYISLYLNELNKTSLYYTLAMCWKEHFSDKIENVYFDWFVTQKSYSLVNLKYDVTGIMMYSIRLERHNLEQILYISGYYADKDRWYVNGDNVGYLLKEQHDGNLYVNYYDEPVFYEVNPSWAFHLDKIVKITLDQ